MAEAASQTADRVLAKSSDRGRRERHAAASRKGKSKSHSCSQAGALLQKASIYIVKKGDTLWDIARRYYDKGSKYEKIARANEGRISDPDLIFPCQRVYLPGRHAWLWLEYDGTVQEDAS